MYWKTVRVTCPHTPDDDGALLPIARARTPHYRLWRQLTMHHLSSIYIRRRAMSVQSKKILYIHAPLNYHPPQATEDASRQSQPSCNRLWCCRSKRRELRYISTHGADIEDHVNLRIANCDWTTVIWKHRPTKVHHM